MNNVLAPSNTCFWIDLRNDEETYLWLYVERDGRPFDDIGSGGFRDDVENLIVITEEQYEKCDHILLQYSEGDISTEKFHEEMLSVIDKEVK